MIPTAASSPANSQSGTSATFGIASLILEGRALSDDEFIIPEVIPSSGSTLSTSLRQNDPNTFGSTSYSRSNNNPTSNSATYFQEQQPQHQHHPQTTQLQQQQQQRLETTDSSIQHFQRLRQKLGQLRQSSPGTSRDYLVEQRIPVGGPITNRGGLSNIAGSSEQDDADDDDSDNDQFVDHKTTSSSLIGSAGQQISEGHFLNSLQSLATTCLRTTPRSFNHRSGHDIADDADIWPNWGLLNLKSSTATIAASNSSTSSVQMEISFKMTKGHSSREKIVAPKQGPHCDQFLKKLGLCKGEATEAEEHRCDMSNLNEICYRWQIHCHQIAAIITKREPICVEVYLGPENHEILLEQWIIHHKEKSSAPNMTLQSLSSAIRSQLYFSQLTAWTDQIKNSTPFDRDILDNCRIKKSTTGGSIQKKPRLDIFHRIKSYDSTACFNCKPNVHNFPDVIISDNCSISVCLKSLPRMHTGIPKIDDFLGCLGTTASTSATISNVDSDGPDQSGILSRDDPMILDDRFNLPCHEKGKHKCAFDEEEGCSSDQITDDVSNPRLSHRERQLMKYRKRILKRDKKAKKSSSDGESQSSEQSMQLEDGQSSNNICLDGQAMELINDNNQQQLQLIQQQQQTLQEFGSINSIRPPLYQTTTSIAEGVQTNSVEMVSVGTQTANIPVLFPSCEFCGCEMQFICWNCDKSLFQGINDEDCDISDSPAPMAKGDILLQAIQRTPRGKIQDTRNNNNSIVYRPISKTDTSDCQLCKRQKTQHNYMSNDENLLSSPDIVNGHLSIGSRTDKVNRLPSDITTNTIIPTTAINGHDYNKESMQNCDCNKESSTVCQRHGRRRFENLFKMSPNDSPNIVTNFTNGHTSNNQLNTPETSKNILKLNDNIDAQFKTPKTHLLSPKNQLKPSPLYINCSPTTSSSDKNSASATSAIASTTKSIPKINLTNIFSCSTSSAPIPIVSSETFSFDHISSEIPVQKSSSAPTLPNSPSLSPRFLKQAAIYKRRSRHLSDRSSERSSIGSDEQLSDEDLESLYSPASSPIKNRIFLRSSAFGRKPILGSLEESLLQKRFTPKCQVAGFKVLLGASGGFCPTQLTIPAAAYFYELSGQSISTPYVCEIRLSRKGYTIPRTGTVQATLLNPLGTVVRMFVIPYDFRDMPVMSQTFIRQRILAVDSEMDSDRTTNYGGRDNGHRDMSFGEQMRSLRYAIHLRFQTSRSGRLALHTDIRLLISRRTDCDTAAAHAKGALESPNELRIVTVAPEHPKYSARQENPNKI